MASGPQGVRRDHKSSLGVGCVVFVLLVLLFAAVAKKKQPDVAEVPGEQTPRILPKSGEPTAKEKSGSGTVKESSTGEETPVKKLISIPLPTAPLPRVVDYALPPPEASFRTDWVRIAGYETRVTGVHIGPAPLRDRAGNEFWSPDSALRVWVETRSTLATTRGLRRWGSTLEPAVLTGAGGMKIPRATVLSGGSLRGELFGDHKLVPGGAAVPDVLAFDPPQPTTEGLILSLDAEHLGERGTFRHFIPARAWKKP